MDRQSYGWVKEELVVLLRLAVPMVRQVFGYFSRMISMQLIVSGFHLCVSMRCITLFVLTQRNRRMADV